MKSFRYDWVTVKSQSGYLIEGTEVCYISRFFLMNERVCDNKSGAEISSKRLDRPTLTC